MNIKSLKKKWNNYGKVDPLWTILTYADKKNNKWKVEEFFKTGQEEIEAVMKYIQSLKFNLIKKKALDFGCGVGRLTQPLANYFEEADGVDIAPTMIELAEKYNQQGARCKYFVNDTDNLKLFPDNNFDFIYTNIVLQHMEPRYSKKYIKEFLRILVPGGLLIFQLPIGKANEQTFKNRLKKCIIAITPKALLDALYKLRYGELRMDVYGVKKEEIVKLVEENGAKVIDITKDEATGSHWISYRYCVTKS